jgi:hypothetical protein
VSDRPLPKHLVNREKDLMVHYIEKHRRGDEKGKSEVMKEIQRNIQQRRGAK